MVIKNFLLFLVFLSLLLFNGCSWIVSHLPQKPSLKLNSVTNGNFLVSVPNSKNSTPLFAKIYNRNGGNNLSELRIIDEKMQVLDAINFNDGTSFLSSITSNDFDKDGISELIFTVSATGCIRFYHTEISNNFDANKIILEIPTPQEHPNPAILYSLADLNNDTYDELIISYSMNYPLPNDLRGVWAIDIINNKLHWYFPTAEFITGLIACKNGVDGSRILFSSSGADNEISFQDGVFNTTGKKTREGNKVSNLLYNSLILNQNNFRSNDSTAYITAIDNSGSIIWRKEVGGSLTWTNLIHNGVDTNQIFSAVRFRKVDSKTKDYIAQLNISNGELIDRFELNARSIVYFFIQDHIIQVNDGDVIITNFITKQIISKKHLPDLEITDAFIDANSQIKIIGRNRSSVIIFDSNYNKLIQIDEPDIKLYYLPSINYYIGYSSNSKIYFYELISIPFFEDISTESLFSWLIAILIILMFIIFLWGLTMSISKKKIIQQSIEIQKSREELEIATAQIIFSEKLAILGSISASIAHELNGPIGAIINSSERLKSIESIDNTLKENNNLIYRAAKRAKDIVSDFLVASRSNPDEEKRTKFSTVFDNWSGLYLNQFSENQISIDYKLNSDFELIIQQADLYQIISNIMFNAKDSLDSTFSENKKIHIASNRSGEFEQITFEDNGSGFSEKILAEPFKIFITTKEKGKGSGLGLWIANNLLKNNSGSIVIGNSKTGAIVTINIPIWGNLKDEKSS